MEEEYNFSKMKGIKNPYVPTISIARKKDFIKLAELRWDFKFEDGERTKLSKLKFCREFVRVLSAPKSKVWTHIIAKDAQRVVGMVSVCRVPKIPGLLKLNDSIGYLTNTYVIPSHRNRRIGKSLLGFAKKWASSQEIELLFVWPSSKSRSLYKRVGFKDKNEIMEMIL